MAKLIVYDPVHGGFFKKAEQFDEVRNAVKKVLGESTFKAGFSAGNPGGATKALKDAFKENGISPVDVEGAITEISYVETKDGQGNTYQKMRVVLKGKDEILLSIDLDTDVAKRLIAKLLNQPVGEYIRINAWPVLETKGERTFINHCVSVKSVFGEEIPPVPGLFATAKEKGDAAVKKLQEAGITDKKVFQTVIRGEQVKFFRAKLDECIARLTRAALVA